MRCRCGNDIAKARSDAGYLTCLDCGEREAQMVKHCVVPMHKSNYVVVTDRKMLCFLNPKRGGL